MEVRDRRPDKVVRSLGRRSCCADAVRRHETPELEEFLQNNSRRRRRRWRRQSSTKAVEVSAEFRPNSTLLGLILWRRPCLASLEGVWASFDQIAGVLDQLLGGFARDTGADLGQLWHVSQDGVDQTWAWLGQLRVGFEPEANSKAKVGRFRASRLTEPRLKQAPIGSLQAMASLQVMGSLQRMRPWGVARRHKAMSVYGLPPDQESAPPLTGGWGWLRWALRLRVDQCDGACW